LPGGDGEPVYQQYITKVRTQGDAARLVRADIVPAMESAGWVVKEGPGEGRWRFARDGYILGIGLFPDDGLASVSGSSPCVQP
jgi:hypothetical protein